MLKLRALGLLVLAVLMLVLGTGATPAQAHGFTSVVYVSATQPERGHVRVDLGLEYDLLMVSVADTEHDDALFKEGDPAWQDGDLAGQRRHSTTTSPP